MTRKECQKKIFDLMLEIVKVYHEYNPDGQYLALQYNCENDDDVHYIQFNNRCWPAMDGDQPGEDYEKPIDWSSLEMEETA